MPEEDNKILKYNHGEKSMKVLFTIFADLESLLEKMNTCHNNPVKKDLVLMMAKKNFKVKDHCHYTGKYRGAAHDICNLRYKTPKEIPVVFKFL